MAVPRLAVALALVALWRGLLAAEEARGKLIVQVAVQGTGEAIAGARIHANVGVVRAEGEVQSPASHLTDASGRCELDVPWGNVRLTPPIPPPGFWPVTDVQLGLNQLQQFVVTREAPTVERRFEFKKGTAWPIRVITRSESPLAVSRFMRGVPRIIPVRI